MSNLETAAREKFLSQVSLFKGLDGSQLSELAGMARVRALKRKEELFHKGDDGSEIYCVVKGKLKALTTSLGGDDVVFSIQGPGDVFGEVAALGLMQRTATVTAVEACELLALPRREFLFFLERHPKVALELISIMARRLAYVSELVEDTQFLKLPARLAKKLLDLAGRYGEETPDGVRVDLKLSQEEWGDLVGTTRESINKQVRTWTKEGLVVVDGGFVVIRRPNELEKLADAMDF
jgi:CRP-like cAMP-binding protein